MQDSYTVLSNLSVDAEKPDFTFKRLYRLLYNKNLYYTALGNIYSNQGSGTPGADGETIDGISEEKFDQIIESLRDESYRPSPARRTYIPKKNGKKRPLGIPAFKDKLVQEVVRMILEAIYEPRFSDNSHGFRKGRSCHTALKKIERTFTGAVWFIEGDVVGCFDNIDHHRLINIMRKTIKDERFIRLIWKFLKAGYLEDWTFHKTYSGTPQGGIISPILCNIYLNEFDQFVENELIPKWDRGSKRRKLNKEYNRLRHRCEYLKKKINQATDPGKRSGLIKEYKETKHQKIKTAAFEPCQSCFKRVKYVRYADDFLVGVIGSKEDCEAIKEEISLFFDSQLNLELSSEKTLITHSKKPAKFLGYEVRVNQGTTPHKDKNGVLRRDHRGRIKLSMPKHVVTDFILRERLVENVDEAPWRYKIRPTLLGLSDLEILRIYNSELRGLYNYYCMAENVSAQMHKLAYPMEYSCLKTMAAKHNSSTAKIRTKLRIGKNWGVPYQTKKGTKHLLFFKEFKRNRNPKGLKDVDRKFNLNVYKNSRTELESRLRAQECEICGAKDVPLEIHHVNKVKNLKGKKQWEKIMIAKRRKTLAVCHECHVKIESGKLD